MTVWPCWWPARTAPIRCPVLPTVEPVPVVGDWVVVDGDAVVDVLERTSLLRRQDPDGSEQHLVANLDALLIVCGLDRPVKPGRIQRSSRWRGTPARRPSSCSPRPTWSTTPPPSSKSVTAASPGVEVVLTSSPDGTGVDAVRALAAGRTIVLLGESGAGKSTLANALVGDDVLATGAVREGDSKGRHTTTRRELHVLPTGGVLIDTPGIRGVGLWVEPDAVAATFDDVESLAEGCRFSRLRAQRRARLRGGRGRRGRRTPTRAVGGLGGPAARGGLG